MLRKSIFGMLAIAGLLMVSAGTASAHGHYGHHYGYGGGYGYRGGYRPGYVYGGYAPRVVVAPPAYGYGYGYPAVGGYGCGVAPGYGYPAAGVGVSTPGFGFYVR